MNIRVMCYYCRQLTDVRIKDGSYFPGDFTICQECIDNGTRDRAVKAEINSPDFKQAPHLFDEMVSELNTEAWNKFKGGVRK